LTILDIDQLLWHVPFSVSVLYSLLLRGDKHSSPPPPPPLDNSFLILTAARSAVLYHRNTHLASESSIPFPSLCSVDGSPPLLVAAYEWIVRMDGRTK
jgi:hypothetical protein